MTTSTTEIIAFSLAMSFAAFLITFAIYQDIPWLYIIDWILIGLYGLGYLLIRAEYKKNLQGSSYNTKYYKPLNKVIGDTISLDSHNSEVTPQ